MKKKHLKILPVFLSLPFLMAMYNGPHFHVYNYDSYDVTYVSHEQVEDNYIYTLTIKHNSGYHYIYSLELKGTIDENSFSARFTDFSDVFCDNLIGPYGETTIKMVSKKEIPDVSKLSKSGDAYRIIDESIKKHYFPTDVVESISLVTNSNDESNPDYNLYNYKINFKEGTDTNFSCGLFELTYNNETVYLMIENFPSGYHIFTHEELDLTKLEVKGITLIEQYRPFSPSGEGILKVSLIILAIVLLIHGALFCAIFFFVRFLIRKKRKAKADLGL